MASAIDKVQSRLQEAMDHGNQASLGQAIDASKGVNGLKQLRRSAKARLKQLSADQNRNMIGSHMPPEEPLTWRVSEQGGRYRAVAHLPTSIIGWVIGHKGCNARMLKQQTGTELWVDVPGQCVIIEARVLQEVEGAMEAVNDFVKTAPTFIAKIQAGSGGGVTETVQCPVHLLPSLQRLSRKIQAESGANCVFANCKMSTFCVTGEKKNVDTAVAMLKRLIAEGNSESANGGGMGGGGSCNGAAGVTLKGGIANGMPSMGGSVNGGHLERRQVGVVGTGLGVRGAVPAGELSQGHGRMGSDLSRSDGTPATAPCSPETSSAANAWGNGAPTQLRAWNSHHDPPVTSAPSSLPAPPGPPPGSTIPLGQMHSHCASAVNSAGGPTPAPFQGGNPGNCGNGGGNGGASSDLSFFSFGVGGVTGGTSVPSSVGGTSMAMSLSRACSAPAAGGVGGGSGVAAGLGGTSPIMLPGLGFLEESAGASGAAGGGSGGRRPHEHDLDDERRASSCGSGDLGGGEAQGFPTHPRRAGSVASGGLGGGGVGGGVGGSGCPLEGNIEDLLEELGLSKYLPVFQSAEVDLGTLCIMSEQDFRELGILKGPRVKIMHHIGSR